MTEGSEYKEDLKKAVDVIRKGGVIIYPTDTIWGLGCDATNPDAIKKLMDIKGCQSEKSFIVLMNSESMLERYICDIPDIAFELMDAAVDPLTIIYDSAEGLSEMLLAADGSIGVRITKEKFSKELCLNLQRPIVSTSANFSGEKSPKIFSDIDPCLIEKVDYTVLYRSGDKTPHTPSKIVKLSKGGVIKIIR